MTPDELQKLVEDAYHLGLCDGQAFSQDERRTKLPPVADIARSLIKDSNMNVNELKDETSPTSEQMETKLFNAMQEKRAALLKIAETIISAEKVSESIDLSLTEALFDLDMNLFDAAGEMLEAAHSYYEYIEKQATQ